MVATRKRSERTPDNEHDAIVICGGLGSHDDALWSSERELGRRSSRHCEALGEASCP